MHSGAPSSAGVSREDTSSASVGHQAGHRYDLLGTSTLENPYPLYDELRVAAPVYRDRRFFGCILTRYDDVVAVLKDSRVSSRRPTADERVPRALSAIAEQLRELRAFQSRWMLYLDPPEHTRLRALVNTCADSSVCRSLAQLREAPATVGGGFAAAVVVVMEGLVPFPSQQATRRPPSRRTRSPSLRRPGYLPSPPTPLVGRAQEIDYVTPHMRPEHSGSAGLGCIERRQRCRGTRVACRGHTLAFLGCARTRSGGVPAAAESAPVAPNAGDEARARPSAGFGGLARLRARRLGRSRVSRWRGTGNCSPAWWS